MYFGLKMALQIFKEQLGSEFPIPSEYLNTGAVTFSHLVKGVRCCWR